ncbi:hypothetical protein SLA2020_324430 [Shorea laevis]
MERKTNKRETGNAVEASAKSQSSEKKMPNSLKMRSKIAKSVAKNFVRTKNAKVTTDVQRKNQKKTNKRIFSQKQNEEGAKELISREEKQHDNASGEDHVENSQHSQKNQENITMSDNNRAKVGTEEKDGGSDKNQNKEKRNREEKRRRNQKERHGLSKKNHKNKEKCDGKKGQQNERKEKLDGLIFMCSTKTKPDCFRYRVMGVTAGKKDLVLGIRPGLKLFLYDFDLKLMYGIYKASSSGGMKLEPKAFGGAFPAQVRFKVHADCYPLPESIFKKAIKENYNEKNKFKIELTARQVRKLTGLFRPVAHHSTALPVRSPPREAYDGLRESRPHSDREISVRDPYTHVDARSYAVLSHERQREIAYTELASKHKEEIPRDLYLIEKDYRAYGLQGERRNLTTQHHIAPSTAPYMRDYDRVQLLRQTDPLYRETVPLSREITHADPLYLTEGMHRTYELGASRQVPPIVPAATASTSVTSLDPYASYPYHYGATSVDTYLPPPRTNTHAYGADADHNRMHRYQADQPEGTSMPVSSRYSFASPPVSYRKLEL